MMLLTAHEVFPAFTWEQKSGSWDKGVEILCNRLFGIFTVITYLCGDEVKSLAPCSAQFSLLK